MNRASESEVVIRRLYQITNDYQKGFDVQIVQLLEMGLQRFELDIGILSKVEGDNYTVQYCVTPEDVPLQQGDSFDYRATYCEITCQARGPISIEHCGKHDVYAAHPAYKAFALESYIGIPIYVDNEIYGTLNFSSPTPYYRKFRDIDIDVMKLMASWIEVELVRRAQELRLKQLNEKLEYQALYDPLTRLPNRRCLFKKLNAEVEKLRAGEGVGSIAVIDIDHFKKVNDNYGHQIGDDVLKKIANVLRENTDEGGIAARFGGEEFIVCYPQSTPEYAERRITQLLQSVKTITLDREPVTISAGVCHFQLADEGDQLNRMSTLDNLIKVADECLYLAKENGRDQFVARPYIMSSQKVCTS